MISDGGFSLLESLLAIALTMIVTGAALAMAHASVIAGQAQPSAIDMQERLRMARDLLVRELVRAGAGMTASPAAGPLNWTIAPIIPRRMGAQSPDPDQSARNDAVTITYVPQTVAQSATMGPVSVASGLEVQSQPNCPAGQPVCGFQAGMTALVFDSTAHFDLFSIPRVLGTTAQLRAHGAGSGHAYAPGAAVTEVESHTYYFDRGAGQLRQYDGDQSDVPIADNIAGVSFEYFGDPDPPVMPKPPLGTANCLYDSVGRLQAGPTLGGTGGLAPLPLSLLTDGPWCGGGATRFDADVLRIRLVRVSVRVQAAASTMRAGGPAFAAPGAARESARALPDLVAAFVVTPRNLGAGR